jgi:eukaryotic-like serine/threonine-protein kinase
MPIYEQTNNRKGLMAAIVAGAISGLVTTVLFWAVVQPLLEMSEVPDVTGKKVEIAKSILEGRGFRVYTEDAISDPAVPEGAVSKQDPVPGQKVRKGSTIKVWPNGAGGAVPALRNLPLPQATVMLQQAGLKLGQVTMQPSDSVPKDAVIASQPPFGAQVSKDAAVDLIISAGAGEVTVPAVKGWGKTRASEMIKQAGLNVGSLRYQFDDTGEIEPGLVIRQDPPAGAKASKGANVSLWISTDVEPE